MAGCDWVQMTQAHSLQPLVTCTDCEAQVKMIIIDLSSESLAS